MEANSHDKNKTVRLVGNLFAGALLAALSLYVLYQVVLVLRRGYETETAILYSMSDSVNINGFLSFIEEPVTCQSDEIGYLVANGDRVSAGTALAEVYSNEVSAADRSEYENLLEQRSILEKSNNNTMDVNNLVSQTENEAVNVLENIDYGQYDSLTTSQANYFINLNKFNYTIGRNDGFTELQSSLDGRIEELQQRLSSAEQVLSDTSGYFIDASHAQILDYDRDTLNAMTPQELNEALLSPDYQTTGENVIGKIITDYVWYFYCICDADLATRIQESTGLKISFPQYSSQQFSAVLDSVTPDEENGETKLVLRCDFLNSDISAFTEKTANFEFKSFEGIRIPVQALHIVDGEKGVYVKYGNLAYFKKIDIIYQNEDYILVPSTVSDTNEVKLYDEIITVGYGLHDGKML